MSSAPLKAPFPWFGGKSRAAGLIWPRLCCGDWARVCNPTTLIRRGTCGLLLDPPYSSEAGRNMGCYGATDDGEVAHQVRSWCVEHGQNPELRIALCGYEGEHEELERLGWSVVAWKAGGGLGNRTKEGRGRVNATRERIWFSPACLEPAQGSLF